MNKDVGISTHQKLYVRTRDGTESLSPKLVFTLAAACGITVANIYWTQPLLDTIAHAFDASTTTVGLIVTFTQIGFALGLVFLVPLGDLLERKRLITSIMYLTVLALMAAAFSPAIEFFIVVSLIIGVTSVVAQILVPFAATLAKDHERGKVVGQVMSGLLIGILLARTLAGIISELAGWRSVFGAAALMLLVLTMILGRALPQYKHALDITYPQLLTSVVHMIKTERVLRIRSAYGALVFANFSVLWTSLTFLLAGPRYNYSDAVIGLFGIVGAAGAFSANIAGKLADKGFSARSTITFLTLILVSFLLMIPGNRHIIPIIIGMILLDAGVQGTHITNQSEIYRLKGEARSRLTTAYMTIYFIGGAIGSATSAAAFNAYRWYGVCALGIGYSTLAVMFWIFEQLVLNRRPANGR